MDGNFLILIGLAVVIYWIVKDKSGTATGTESRQTASLPLAPRSELGVGDRSYVVSYTGGHKHTDHYMHFYVKAQSLPGRLKISSSGVQFVCTATRTTQRINLKWEILRDATYEGSSLSIGYYAAGVAHFSGAEAQEIAEEISFRKARFNEAMDRRKQLEGEHIRARNLDQIAPESFEKLVGDLFRARGYTVSHVGRSGDGGIDLKCMGPDGDKVFIQCKRYGGKVSVPTIRDFYGTLIDGGAAKGFVVTTGEFTKDAIEWAKSKPITLVDRHELAELLDEFGNDAL